MIAEIIRVDAKGRITIPAYVRLLLNVDEGSKVLMSVDEERGLIVLRSLQGQVTRCTGILSKRDLLGLISSSTRLVSIKCVSDISNADTYRCDITIADNTHEHKLPEKMNCRNI